MKKIIIKLIGFFIALGIILAGLSMVAVMTIYPKLPSMDELHNYHPKLPLQIFSDDNVLLGQFGDEKRIFITFAQTPKMLINAILAAEDARFYEHGGIDIRGVLRAAIGDITSRSLQSGASTITMQVARNFFLSSKKTFNRKFYEILLAYKIEQSLTKDQILELYINQIYLGQRAYGFAEASLIYFGKPLDKLTIAQYAVLAGLPKAPSAFNPIVNKKRSKERELYVLGRMRDAGFINQTQYNEAVNQDIKIAKGTINDSTNAGGYVAEWVRQIMYAKYGDSIYSEGYKVYTTINSKMQQSAYTSLRNGLLQYTMSHGYKGPEKQINLPNDSGKDLDEALSSAFDDIVDYGDLKAAIVLNSSPTSITAQLRDDSQITITGDSLKPIKNSQIVRGSLIRVQFINNKWNILQAPEVEGSIVAINPNNGAIKALIGGFDFTRNNYNHATQSMRQPGSGFKPFIYSAALEHGFSANTTISNSRICFSKGGNDGGVWCPKNDNPSEDFIVDPTFREALAKSLNIPTIKLINAITPQFVIDYLVRFGFNKNQFQPYLTMALGANEVTPLQLAQAYAVFANGGYLVNPYIIDTITDSTGQVLAKTNSPDISKESPTIDPRNAYIINSVLQDTVRYGTGSKVYQELRRNDIAGKTGTTSKNKDVWFNGYTPNLVAITWVGFDQPKSLGAHAYGASIAIPIWVNFMKNILNQIPQVELQIPPGIAVLKNVSWKGNDDYVYVNESYLTNLGDNADNEESATGNEKDDLTDDLNDNNQESNAHNGDAMESLIKGLF
ncbi:MAG: penicillin-binding protein 1A [Neisseriaceae bacterium]